MDFIGILNIVADNSRNLGIGLLVFATNLMLQAVVTLNQTQALTIQRQEALAKAFRNGAWGLLGAGGICILFGVLLYVRGLTGDNWLVSAYTLFIVAASLIAWWRKLVTADYKGYGKCAKTAANWLLGVAIFLLVVYLWITTAVTLKWIQ